MTKAKQERNNLILRYRSEGYSLREIAEKVGNISHERVRQVINTLLSKKVDKRLTGT